MKKLEEAPARDLDQVTGGLKWQGRRESTNVEDRRPHVVCTPVWPQGDKGPSVFGDPPPPRPK